MFRIAIRRYHLLFLAFCLINTGVFASQQISETMRMHAEVLAKISTNAMADHSPADYVKGALSKLGKTYSMNFSKQWSKLNDRNAIIALHTTIEAIQQRYPEIELVDIQNTAFDAMLKLIDSNSYQLDKKAFDELRVGTPGDVASIGVDIKKENEGIKIVEVLQGNPAQQANVPGNSLLLSIDNQLLEQATLTEVVNKLRGKPGSEVSITLLHDGQRKKYKLIRKRIHVQNIKLKWFADDILYIRIRNLNNHTTKHLKRKLHKLEKSIKGIVLDLRKNQGGLLTEVVSVCDLFLPAMKLFSVKGKLAKNDLDYSTSSSGMLQDIAAIAILVDKFTASGAELIAQALRTRKNTSIIGSRTFGIAGIRTILPLGNGTAMVMTTSKLYLPSGETWHEKGVFPDICINYQNNKVLKKRNCEQSEFHFSSRQEKDVALKQAIQFVTK